jgi:hypothetical protein
MSHPVRRFLFASLVVLHTVFALCGPGHHAMTGGSGRHHAARSEGRETVVEPAEAMCPSDGHCPVCDYLAQGQLPVKYACLPLGQVAEPAKPCERPSRSSTPTRSPTIPRAPPLAFADAI